MSDEKEMNIDITDLVIPPKDKPEYDAVPAKAKRKPGRPSKQTKETRERLIHAAAIGYASFEAIARAAGISADTLQRMWAADQSLRQDIEAARDGAIDKIEASVLSAATDDPRLGLQVLRARRAASYNERSKVELTGADGGPIQHELIARVGSLSDEEIAEAIRALNGAVDEVK
jgi:hypothetical protein